MRMMFIKDDTDFAALGEQLVRARTGADQTRSALESLQALNPHVDVNKIRAGTVLLVPDAPAFKVSATAPLGGEAIADFQKLVKTSLADAAARLKDANAARAAAHAETSAAFKTAAVKRLLESDRTLKAQIDAAVKAFKDDEQQAADAERTLESSTRDALAALKALIG